MAYADYAVHEASLAPIKGIFAFAALYNETAAGVLKFTNPSASRTFHAAGNFYESMAREYGKPDFGFDAVQIGDDSVALREKIVLAKDFGNLLHFERDTDRNDPKILLVAPLSGHYATLLRGTVEALLPHHDVYVTDWANARDVPREKGSFGLSDYVRYINDFVDHIGPGTHIIGVCQPGPAILAATALKAAKNEPNQPLSMTLMGAPIDTRAAPTEVTRYAEKHDISYFEDHAISEVPLGYAGHGRPVYPGFKQLSSFMAMNPERHVQSSVDRFNHLRRGDGESAGKIDTFYREYLAVLDMPEEFFLDTIEGVFLKHKLPKGELIIDNQIVDPSKIRQTALMTVEGEKDDICAPGQTSAAHKLCNNIAPQKHFHHLQAESGHYGIFEGRRWRGEVCPRVAHFVRAQGVDNGLKYSEIPANTRLIPPNLWGQNAPLLTQELIP